MSAAGHAVWISVSENIFSSMISMKRKFQSHTSMPAIYQRVYEASYKHIGIICWCNNYEYTALEAFLSSLKARECHLVAANCAKSGFSIIEIMSIIGIIISKEMPSAKMIAKSKKCRRYKSTLSRQ